MKPNTKRDPFEVTALWTVVLCTVICLMCISVVSPLAYIWILGLSSVIAIPGVTICILVALSSDDSAITPFIATDVIATSFRVIALILGGLSSVGR